MRPIAVGEVLRRLTASAFAPTCATLPGIFYALYKLGWPPAMALKQLSTLPDTGRRGMQGRLNRFSSKIDFSNAFNTVDRASLLRETRFRLPGLSPWAEWCHGLHSRLLFQSSPLSSETGVQRGDPLGPLLLLLQPALQAAASGGPPELRPSLVVAYLDDVCLASSYRQVSAGLVRLTAAARQVGLQVNPAKCELVACGGAAATVDMSPFPPGIPLNQTGSFSLFGGAHWRR